MMENWNIGKTNCLSDIPLFHFFLCDLCVSVVKYEN